MLTNQSKTQKEEDINSKYKNELELSDIEHLTQEETFNLLDPFVALNSSRAYKDAFIIDDCIESLEVHSSLYDKYQTLF